MNFVFFKRVWLLEPLFLRFARFPMQIASLLLIVHQKNEANTQTPCLQPRLHCVSGESTAFFAVRFPEPRNSPEKQRFFSLQRPCILLGKLRFPAGFFAWATFLPPWNRKKQGQSGTNRFWLQST